jgi:WD repeat-containing protein 89
MVLLVESPYLQTYSSPLRSSSSSSQAYILSIACLPSHYAASASAPSNIIDIFDKSTLQGIQTLPGHSEATTSLHSVHNVAGISNMSLMSSGKDGSVKIWDERSNSHSIKSG